MNYQQKYLKYKQKYLNLSKKGGANQLVGQYTSAMFIDNSQEHLDTVLLEFPKIIPLKIEETSKDIAESTDLFDQLIRRIRTDDPYYDIEFNSYYKNIITNNESKEAYDPISGIIYINRETESPTKIAIIEFINSHRPVDRPESWKKCMVIFDWDRTISVIEGLIAIKDASYMMTRLPSGSREITPSLFLEDLLIYSCGGPNRLVFLRKLMKEIYDNNIDIVICTNNGLCPLKNFYIDPLTKRRIVYDQKIFHEIIDQFMNGGGITIPKRTKGTIGYIVICSKNYGNNKATALKMDQSIGLLMDGLK